MPNPTIVGGTQNNAAIASGTSATVTSTGSVTAGNLLVVFLVVGGASAPSALTAPDATWTTAMTTIATASGGTIVAAIFTKQVTATGAFSGAFSWTTTATSGHWALTEWSTALGARVLLDGAVARTQNASGTNTSPSVTPGGGTLDTLICCSFGGVVGVDTLTVPAGMTAISSMATPGTASVPFFYGASLALASAAATGAKTWTIPTSQTNLGVSLLLQSQPVWGFEQGGTYPLSQLQMSRSSNRAAAACTEDHDDGNYQQTRPPRLTDYYQVTSQPRRPRYTAAALKGQSGFAFSPFVPMVWEPVLATYKFTPKQRFAAFTEDRDDGSYLPTPPPPPPPVGYDVQQTNPRINFAKRYPGIRGRSEFAIFPTPFPEGWQVQPWQPPHPRPERSGALALGDTGTQAKLVAPALPPMWDIQPPQPPHLRTEVRFGALARGDDGTEAPLVLFVPPGGAVLPFQPPYRRAGQPGALARWLDGIDAPLRPPPVAFFDVTASQPLFPRTRTYGALMPRADGIESPFVNWINLGFEQVAAQDRHPTALHRPGALLRGLDGIELPLPPPAPPWFELTSPFLAHPRPERSGAIAPWLDGTPMTVPFLPFGFEPVFAQPPHRVFRSPEFGDAGGIDAPFVRFTAMDWPWTPMHRHPAPERSGAIARGADGIELPMPTALAPWFETTPALSLHRFFRSPETGDPGIAATLVNFIPTEWPFVPTYRHPRPERSGALARGADGIELPLPPVLFPWFETSPPTTRHAILKSPEFGDPGIASPFVLFTALEWPPPPMHRNPTRRAAGAVMRGDDGNYVQSFLILPLTSWPEPPMHRNPAPRLAGAIMRGDDGIEAVLPPFVTIALQWWDDRMEQLRVPPVRYGATLFGGDSGTQATLVHFVPMGWEVQPPQPPHPRPERHGALGRDQELGIASPFVRFVPLEWPWQAMQRHPTPERSGALARGDDGTESPLPPVFRPWFETTPPPLLHRLFRSPETGEPGIAAPLVRFVPMDWPWTAAYPHPRPERSAAVARGLDGIDAPTARVLVPWFETPVPPTLRRGYRAPEPGDAGIAAPWVRFTPLEWPSAPMHRRPRPERFGSLARGEDGNELPMPPVVAPWFETSPPPTRRPRYTAAAMKGQAGFSFPLARFVPMVWEAQVQHLRRLRFRSPEIGDAGIAARFVVPFREGWAVQPPQPPHPRRERSGAIMLGEPGIEAKFVPPKFIPWGHEAVLPILPARPLRHGAALKHRITLPVYVKFVPTLVATAKTIIRPYSAAPTIGIMEIKQIISGFDSVTIIRKKDP